MLLRGFRLFGVALHREPKGTKRLLFWFPAFFLCGWGGRNLDGAMDWAALQRASLALSSGALCSSG